MKAISNASYNNRSAFAINVVDLGAKGDGSTNDTVAFNNALASGKKVFIPQTRSGMTTYVVDPLTLPSGASIECAGRDLVTIKLAPGAKSAILTGANFAVLENSRSNSGADNINLQNCTFDGNSSVNTANSIDGLDFYGAHPVLEHVLFQNLAGTGLHSEYAGTSAPGTGEEGFYHDVRFLNIGQDGWDNFGPSDSECINIVMQDVGQNNDNTFIGMNHAGLNSSVRMFNFHGYYSGNSPKRVKYWISTNGGSQYVNSEVEGGRGGIEFKSGVTDQYVGGAVYANAGSTMTPLVSIVGDRVIMTATQISCSNLPNYGVRFGSYNTKTTLNVLKAITISDCGVLGAFDFAGDGGYNIIDGSGTEEPGGVRVFSGQINQSDRIDYDQTGTTLHMHNDPFRSQWQSFNPILLCNREAGIPISAAYTQIGNTVTYTLDFSCAGHFEAGRVSFTLPKASSSIAESVVHEYGVTGRQAYSEVLPGGIECEIIYNNFNNWPRGSRFRVSGTYEAQ